MFKNGFYHKHLIHTLSLSLTIAGKKPASFVDVGSAPAEVNASVEKDSPNVPVFTTPTRNSVDEFNLFLSPSPTKCEHHQQLSKLEDKLDRVLDILEKKLGNESQPPPQPTDQGKTTQWFNKTPPPVLPPPQLPGPSYAPSSSIVSPQLSSDHDSILDDLCSMLSDDVVNNPIHYFEPTGATPNNYGLYGQTAEQPNIAHNSMMNVQSVGTTHSHLPMETAAASSKPLLSPERAMTRFPGRDEKTLRALAVALARDCVFGTDVMLQSTPSGRGNNQTHQLDPEKLDYMYIKHIISRRMGKQPGNPEFELIWGKCVVSIGKQCQKLRTKAKKRM